MVERFLNNDEGYESWCNKNNTAFVFNFFGGNYERTDMNKIHRANCPYLWRKADEGKRTAKNEKVCSSDIDELIEFVKSERGDSWSYCMGNRCFKG